MKLYYYFLTLILFTSCDIQDTVKNKSEISVIQETKGKISLELNGEKWTNTSDIYSNFFFADKDKNLLDVHFGGQDEKMQGFGINLRIYRNGLENILGKYPIYANSKNVEGYSAILNGGINDLSFDTQMLPATKEKPIGFVQIKEAKVGYNRNGPFFEKLKAVFEAAFETDNDGHAIGIKIHNGLIDLKDATKSDPTYKTGFQINLNGQEWESDRQEFSATKTDDGKEMAIVISAEKSGMDMDPDNEGWRVRFYLDIPLSKIKNFKGIYYLGPETGNASLYFEHGAQVSLEGKANLLIEDMEVLELEGTQIIVFLKGQFTIYPKDGGKEINGRFHIRDYDTGRI